MGSAAIWSLWKSGVSLTSRWAFHMLTCRDVMVVSGRCCHPCPGPGQLYPDTFEGAPSDNLGVLCRESLENGRAKDVVSRYDGLPIVSHS